MVPEKIESDTIKHGGGRSSRHLLRLLNERPFMPIAA